MARTSRFFICGAGLLVAGALAGFRLDELRGNGEPFRLGEPNHGRPLRLGCLPVAAHADDITVTGAAGGAVTGAIVGGPVGAVIGGVIGTAVAAPPAEVVAYVQTQQVEPVYLSGDLVVGATVPENGAGRLRVPA